MFLVIFLLSFNSALAVDINVALDDSIQEAITASSDGDVLLLAAGTYNEDIDFVGKAITVRGDAEGTILEGTGNGPVVTFNTDEGRNSVIENLTVTGGNATRGGGILIENAAPSVKGSLVQINRAESSGSGIYILGGNTAGDFALIQNNLIARNSAVDRNAGDPHGLQINTSSPEVINNTVVRNDSNGIFISGGGSSDPIIRNNIIAYNGTRRRSQRRGRGICFVGGAPDDVAINNNLFFRNTIGDFFLNGQDFKRIGAAESNLNLDGFKDNLRGNPRFRSLKRLNVRLRNKSRASANGDDSTDIGLTGGSEPNSAFL